jgi:hypothetical protein
VTADTAAAVHLPLLLLRHPPAGAGDARDLEAHRQPERRVGEKPKRKDDVLEGVGDDRRADPLAMVAHVERATTSTETLSRITPSAVRARITALTQEIALLQTDIKMLTAVCTTPTAALPPAPTRLKFAE